MAEETICSMAKRLRLQNTRERYGDIIKEAMRRNASYEGFLSLVLERECEAREAKAIAKRIKGAGFPYERNFGEIDWGAFSIPAANAIRELQSLRFVEDGRNAVLIGNPGVGKTHIAISAGILACQKGKTVLFESVPDLALQLKESLKERQVVALKRKLMSYDLLILDELGYVSFDSEASQLLFNLISNRSEGKSTLITTNLTFEKWPSLFGDTMMAAAMVDRIANKATVVEIIGESYRVRQTSEWMKREGTGSVTTWDSFAKESRQKGETEGR